MSGTERIDLLLVKKQLAPSRNRAQDLIKAGAVQVLNNGIWRGVEKSSEAFSDQSELRVSASEANRYVSRGGLKLEAALAETQLNVKGQTVLDVGQSTGGFTDCLLQHGAAKIVGVDVGHSQLVEDLRTDPRVVAMEGINARNLSKTSIVGEPFSLVVCDVSFISLSLVLPEIATKLRDQGSLLALVKPQFELGPEALVNGVVRDLSRYGDLQSKLSALCLEHFLELERYFPCALRGRDGNQEFFLLARKFSTSAGELHER